MMAYFSNGSEGDRYQEANCERCMHWAHDAETDTYGCPVWDAHHFFDHGTHKDVLDLLIPMKDGFPGECTMFLRGEHPSKAQHADQLALDAWVKAVQA